ncbi:MAG: TonB-dependent receptor [Bryobacterales bacterium]|nr:TonB-dependent receptor [Bryobacterales bacterium]
MSKLGVGLFLLSTSLFAQVNGRLAGIVTDPSGAAVPNAQVDVLVPGGVQAVYSAKTNDAGLFSFSAVRPEIYEVVISAPGFSRFNAKKVKVDPLTETSLGTVKLEVASTEQTVEVVAGVEAIQLTSNELSTTVTRQQIQDLPALGRQVSALFTTQAGVSDGRGPTVINGMRTSAANVTLDGVNIQDNFIRNNSLDFMPIRPTIEQISEMAIAVGNASSTVGGGAAQVTLSTRSGSNEFHGSVYWYNRNSAFSANEFFNNRSGVRIPFLNLNQPGASLGGRIIRDKLFFYGNWEEFKLRQQSSQLRTVLTPSARTGVFQYNRGANSANLLQLRSVSVDSFMAPQLQALPEGNSTDRGDGFNTTGYRFNARANTDRRQYVGRLDYYMSSAHSFSGTYNYTFERNDRPDLSDRFYTPIAPTFTSTDRHFTSLGWRWTASPSLTNEFRGGFLLSPTQFMRDQQPPNLFVTNTLFTNPVNEFLPQGRYTNTYSIQDNATWLKGKHEISFGFQGQLIRTEPYNDGATIPTYTLGISANNTTGFTATQLPGINTGDLNNANLLYSSLGGIISSSAQTFNVTSATSGFVPGAGERRNFLYDTYAGYVQDRWKMNRRLTLTLGLRYEYWTVLKERDNLWLLPGLVNNDLIATLRSPDLVHDFVGKDGRFLYRPDRNNFAPNVGVAWDPFGDGKTSVRGGYSISFINDETLTAVRNNVNTNPGLATSITQVGLVARTSAAPAVPTPRFQVPITQAQNYANNSQVALGIPDPNTRTPYIQQFSVGIQRDFRGTLIEARYVGNRGTSLLRAFDYNQVNIRDNGFLADFVRARNNAFLSERAGQGFNPNYNGPGSQPLTVFPRLANPAFTNATVQQRLRQGEAGELANFYQINRVNGPINFYGNPNTLGANTISNGAYSSYNALQVDVRRRLSSSLQVQANYTYSKVLSDVAGDGQNRFEPFLDFGNNALEKSRAPFDITHAIKANGSYNLPYGKGRRWSGNRFMNHVLGGWVATGVMTWQSGFPFSILSNRGTLNRAARSTNVNTATSLLNKSQLDSLFELRKQGDGVFMVPVATRNTDGRAVANDGAAPFSGQAFFHPEAGNVGALQRRMFSGPFTFALDMGMLKRFEIREGHTLEFRGQAYNLPNHPTFSFGDQDINSVNFGRLTSTLSSARVWEFGLYYRF